MNFPENPQEVYDFIAVTLHKNEELSTKELTMIKASLNMLAEFKEIPSGTRALPGINVEKGTFNINVASEEAEGYLGDRHDNLMTKNTLLLTSMINAQKFDKQVSFESQLEKDDIAQEMKNIGFQVCDHVIELQGFVIHIKGLQDSLTRDLMDESTLTCVSTDIERYSASSDHFSPQDNVLSISFSEDNMKDVLEAVNVAIDEYKDSSEYELGTTIKRVQPMIPGYKNVNDMAKRIKSKNELSKNKDFKMPSLDSM